MSEASEMTDEQIQEQLEALQRERQRRDEAAAKEEEKTALAAQINDLLLRYKLLCVDGDSTEWVEPVSAVDAYPRGAVVTHDGQEWESTVVANVWEPGVSGWRPTPERDETGTEIPSPYVPPTGNHDSYQEGERITWSDGLVYEAVRSGVVHSPDEHPDSWVLIKEHEEEAEPEDPGEDDEDDRELEHEHWDPDGRAYTAGELLTYGGSLYEVVQAHTSQPGWTPDAVASLYQEAA